MNQIDLRYGRDVLEVLREMPSESVQCCVTSPPYYALRDYGTGLWEGGNEACDHKSSNGQRIAESAVSVNGGGQSAAESGPSPFKATCRCGNGVAGVAVQTLGWEPGCKCGAAVRPCVALDPFCGSGTTGAVAFDLGLDFIGIDLNAEYLPLAQERIGGLFAGATA